jgi:hypothetical protein
MQDGEPSHDATRRDLKRASRHGELSHHARRSWPTTVTLAHQRLVRQHAVVCALGRDVCRLSLERDHGAAHVSGRLVRLAVGAVAL